MNELIKKYIDKIQNYNLELTTVTPIAVRTEEVFSPLVDYHIDGGKLYYIDTQRLANDIADKGWIEDYEAMVLEYSTQGEENGTVTQPKRKNHFIDEFLKNRSADIKTYLLNEKSVSCTLEKDDEWIQLRPTIKINDQPYIPASSIKGAIRTALIYSWLTENKNGTAALKDFIEKAKNDAVNKVKKINNLKHKRWILEKDKSEEEKKQPSPEIEKINEDIWEARNNGKQQIISVLNEFEEKISAIIFGINEGVSYNSASRFKLSDTLPLSLDNLFVGKLSKKYREDDKLAKKKKKEFTPSLQEFINKGISTQFNISIPQFELDWKNVDKNGYFAQKLWSNKGLKDIFIVMNKFSSDYLEYEIAKLRGFKESGEGKFFMKSGLSSLLQQFEEIKTSAKEIKFNESIICLGFGKSFFANTVALALRTTFHDEFRNIMDLLTKGMHPRIKEFPFSYYCISLDKIDYPLGWVKITDTNEILYQDDLEKSYTEAELKSGNQIEGVIVKLDKPHVKVKILVDGIEKEYNVQGKKNYEKSNPPLSVNQKCIFYYNSGNYNFNK